MQPARTVEQEHKSTVSVVSIRDGECFITRPALTTSASYCNLDEDNHSINNSVYPENQPLYQDSKPFSSCRQRTAQACDKCRERKTKCSGERPGCQRCQDRGLICEYSIREARSRGISKTRAPGISFWSSFLCSADSEKRTLYRPVRPYTRSLRGLDDWRLPSARSSGVIVGAPRENGSAMSLQLPLISSGYDRSLLSPNFPFHQTLPQEQWLGTKDDHGPDNSKVAYDLVDGSMMENGGIMDLSEAEKDYYCPYQLGDQLSAFDNQRSSYYRQDAHTRAIALDLPVSLDDGFSYGCSMLTSIRDNANLSQ